MLGERGVYGLAVHGLSDTDILAPVSCDAPIMTIVRDAPHVVEREESYDSCTAEISLIEGGWVSLTRAGHATFTLPEGVSDEELIHPWLVPAAATLSGWHRRQVLHAGVVAVNGRGVVVVGNKEDGKSSLLAWLAQTTSADILADDLAVIDRGRVFAGPRCIDLRAGSADVIGSAGDLRLVRGNERFRLGLRPCPEDVPLSAFLVLEWGQESASTLRRLAPAEGLAALLPHALAVGERSNLLELLGIPVWSLRRPRSWAAMPIAARRLLDVAEACDERGLSSELQVAGLSVR